MIVIEIPGREPLKINHVVLDYNGTAAVDGMLLYTGISNTTG